MSVFKAKMHWGATPDHAEGAYGVPPDALAGFKGPVFQGKGEKGRERYWRFPWLF